MTKSKATCTMVGYRRTSSDDQKLGIQAQDEILKRIARERGCDLVKVYTEHESGGDNERPELAKALNHARRIGAILVVSKLDRLARDATFLLKLYDGNVPIIFGDLPLEGSTPETAKMIVSVMACVAEFERKRIGTRTREALQVLKANGRKLGNPQCCSMEGRFQGARTSADRRMKKADAEMSDARRIAVRMNRQRHSLRAIAKELEVREILTRNGSPTWNANQVRRLLVRHERLEMM
jgi:DNA invertase Pin-like site-specific DNA recombinase